MKQGIILSSDWEYIGARLAQENSTQQTNFFRAFVRECLSWGTHFQVETQLCDINKRLTPEERRVLAMLGYEEKL